MAKVVVLGAGFAGVSVCMELIGSDHEVELLDVNGSHEYKPGLIDLFRERFDEEDLRFNLNSMFQDTDIEFHREKVKDVDPKKQIVETNAGSHDYSYLVVALGSDPADYGLDLSSATGFYSMVSAKNAVENVEDAEQVTVVGAGYVGVEVASEINEMGKDVSMVDAATRPMARASEDTSHKVLGYLNESDISFRGGSPAKRVEDGKTVLENGKSIEHDEVIWAAGIQASEVVQDSLGVGRRGVEVDEYFRWKKYPEVFALGDCADLEQEDTAHNAMKQAEKVASNIDSRKDEMKSVTDRKYPMVVSLGDTGMMLYGETALRNRLFRKLKDYVYTYYRLRLKKQKLKGRVRSVLN